MLALLKPKKSKFLVCLRNIYSLYIVIILENMYNNNKIINYRGNNMKIKAIILTIICIIAFTACSESSEVQYKKLTEAEAIEMMTDDAIILDVRTPEEFETGYIENAILIPDYEIETKAEEVLTDKEQVILVYCRTGSRSANAVRGLIDLGYTNVYDFGGIETDWTGEVVTE